MAQRFGLGQAAAELYTGGRLSAVLDRLLTHSREHVGATAGSISLIDASADRYAKLAEYGASCQLGRTFSLADGVTGQVVARRAPVVLASYQKVPGGHLPAADPASRGAVAAVPIWWLGDVIGANIAFAGRGPRFSPAQVDRLEMLTQLAATAIARTRAEWPQPIRRPAGSAATSPRAPQIRGLTRHGLTPQQLTPREQEILGLVAAGLADREIAARLVISPKTVEKHVAALLRKTGTARRTAAVVTAMQWGWLSLDALRG